MTDAHELIGRGGSGVTKFIAIRIDHPRGYIRPAVRNPSWRREIAQYQDAPRWYNVSAWLMAPILWWPAILLQQFIGKPINVWCYNVTERRFSFITVG